MEVLGIIGYVGVSLAAVIYWAWSGITLSRYVKKGKSVVVAYTWYWVFNPNWFTEEGQPVFRKERRRFLGIMALFGLVILGPFYIGW